MSTFQARVRVVRFPLVAVTLASLGLSTSGCRATLSTPQGLNVPILDAYAANVDPAEVKATAAATFDPASVRNVAMFMERTSRRRDPSDLERGVVDEMLQALLAKGYNVTLRSDEVQGFLKKEIKFQQDGFTEGEAAELGRMLKVDAVFMVWFSSGDSNGTRSRGNKTGYRATSEVRARLVAVEQAALLWTGSARDDTWIQSGTERTSLEALARALAQAFPARSAAPGPSTPRPGRADDPTAPSRDSLASPR